MVEYNYLYKMFDTYGSYINGMDQNTKEWQNATHSFAGELYQVLYDEEKFMLGQIRNSASSTYEIKWGNDNGFV